MNISDEAVEAAQRAVIDAMVEHGPDGHIDGYEEITRAALEAAAPHLMAPILELADKWQDEFPYKADLLRAAISSAGAGGSDG